jgi:hypothetical protein
MSTLHLNQHHETFISEQVYVAAKSPQKRSSCTIAARMHMMYTWYIPTTSMLSPRNINQHSTF